MNTLTISAKTAHSIIRKNFGLPESFKIVIDESTTDAGWFDVPQDYRHRVAPAATAPFRLVEVEFADGTRNVDSPNFWSLSWSRDYPTPIVRFRKFVPKTED